jgi:hypothetical protein
MIRAYALTADRLKPLAPEADDVVWWNLVNPDRSEETASRRDFVLSSPQRTKCRRSRFRLASTERMAVTS